jgi:hypothetical protein
MFCSERQEGTCDLKRPGSSFPRMGGLRLTVSTFVFMKAFGQWGNLLMVFASRGYVFSKSGETHGHIFLSWFSESRNSLREILSHVECKLLGFSMRVLTQNTKIFSDIYPVILPACKVVTVDLYLRSEYSSKYSTSQKAAVSYPGQIIWSFYWPNISGRIMALGSNQTLTEMSTRNLPEGKVGPARKAEP